MALAAVFVLQRRGGDDDAEERRAAVSAYIVEVNITQQTLIVELERVSLAYCGLRLQEKADPKQLARVEEAERTLRGLRSRLAALGAPAEAMKLRRLILGLVDLQVQLAGEVAGIARYIPMQAAECRELARATNVLRDRLAEADTGAGQKEAFDAYRASLIASARRLDQASVPTVLKPSRSDEVKRLSRLSRLALLARELGKALEEQRAKDVDVLFPRFVLTSASAGTTKAERDAVIAFNRRLERIGKQRIAVAAERTRLGLALQ